MECTGNIDVAISTSPGTGFFYLEYSEPKDKSFQANIWTAILSFKSFENMYF